MRVTQSAEYPAYNGEVSSSSLDSHTAMNTTATTRTRTAGTTRKGEACALRYARVAQTAERYSCKLEDIGAIPITGSKKNMNTLNTIQSITIARAVRVGSIGICTGSSTVERSTDNRKTEVQLFFRAQSEPLNERWRAPTHSSMRCAPGADWAPNPIVDEFDSLTPRCCTGGSTDLFTTGA